MWGRGGEWGADRACARERGRERLWGRGVIVSADVSAKCGERV